MQWCPRPDPSIATGADVALVAVPPRCDDEVMSTGEQNPVRQLADACQAAASVAAEWAQRTAEVTADSIRKLNSDPAVRELLETLRFAFPAAQRVCQCACAESHPDDMGVCDHRAVITRSVPGAPGRAEVRLCAPCAVAQGVAEMPG
jgi:hypothetical protein